MLVRVSMIVFLYVVWLALSGHYDVLLLTFGLVSVAGTAWCVARMRAASWHESNPSPEPNAITYRLPVVESLRYCGWLAKEILVSNIDVARRVWQTQMPIDPVMIVVEDDELDDVGKVIYANSITLTPGTVSLFLRDDGIHVHALTQSGAEALASGEMLRRVQRLRVVNASVWR